MYDIHGDGLATQIVDLIADILEESDVEMQVRFEDLTAEPGELPRLMVSPIKDNNESKSYISGEAIVPFPFALYFRQTAFDEQDRLDAHQFLTQVTEQLLGCLVVLDGYVAYRKPSASVPFRLGATEAFEDWQVTFDLTYKQQRRKA